MRDCADPETGKKNAYNVAVILIPITQMKERRLRECKTCRSQRQPVNLRSGTSAQVGRMLNSALLINLLY